MTANLRERTLIGRSEAIRKLMEQIERVAAADSNVLIIGETGTGKELVGELLHQFSPRAKQPLCTINCAAISESLLESELFGFERGAFTGADQRRSGLFERAHRGTLFLDEVGELSLTCQAKLLRVLEGKPFQRIGGGDWVTSDVRVVAATHRDLAQMAQAGQFRQDLYFRLRVVEIRTPALRDRHEDLAELVQHFLETYASRNNRPDLFVTPNAWQAIVRHTWPGNVRELKNTIERATLMASGPAIQAADLDLQVSTTESPHEGSVELHSLELQSLGDLQQQYVRQVLKALDGNKTAACRVLKISRATLYNKLGPRHG